MSEPQLVRLEGPAAQRFTIQRCLGQGGMGVVYEAYDHERRVLVALKSLTRAEPGALLRFKNEFRALADLSHPNLVSLEELFSGGEQWFFTMELIRGGTFMDHVRPRSSPAESQASEGVAEEGDTADTGILSESAAAGDARPVAAPRAGGHVDMHRLVSAAGQLALGVHALHSAGRLHCDLKPSNVLVEEGGRVVVCDFGLISELTAESLHVSGDRRIAGTAAYMSPEQAGARQLTEASDWYAVGVMLFQALTGRLPFTGEAGAVRHMKQHADAPDLATFAQQAAPGLVGLVNRLLARDPAARPPGADVVAELGGSSEGPSASSVSLSRDVFVGREAQVAALWRAFGEARAGSCRSVFLRGRSGMGKTAIAQRFLGGVRQGAQALILPGRCYERESVPYKTLDGIVDALTEYLARLPAAEVATFMPADAAELNRLFPVLRRIPAFADLAADELAADAHQLRRRAFQALRGLVTNLAVRAPLILFIDDLQWSDADGAALLAEIMRPPGPDRVMLVCTYREEDAASARILSLRAELGPQLEEVEVGPLSQTEADALARSLLGRRPSSRHVETVAHESGGSPLFVAELAHFARANETLDASISLEAALQRRIEALDPAARELLTMVAVAGRPVPRDVIGRATGLGEEEGRALATLRSAHMVRTTRVGEETMVEAYHDRIRENAFLLVPAEALPALHRRMAHALGAAGKGESEAAAEHWLGAGEVEKAARLAIDIARQAAAALAFDQAARMLRLAIEHGTHSEAERARLQFELGGALASSGRAPTEAAAAYLEAARTSTPLDALEARRCAANELLRSGHINEGLEVIRDVLAAANLSLSPTPFAAVRSLLWRRAQLRLRGLEFEERPVAEIPEEVIRAVDTTWSVSRGLGIVDNIRASVFQNLNLLQALRAGDPYRVSRAMVMEACYLATTAGKGAERGRELLVRARKLAERTGDPAAMGTLLAARCVVYYLDGRWRAARDFGVEGVKACEHAAGVEWERTTADLFGMMARMFLGELQPVFAEFPERLREAVQTHDLYTSTNLRTRVGYLYHLARDDVGAAFDEVQRARQDWSYAGHHLQHYFALYAEAQTLLFAGRPLEALEAVETNWPAYKKAFLLRIATVQMILRDIRGRAALAAAQSGGPRQASLLARARADGRELEKASVGGARPLGALLVAGVARLAGDEASALTSLDRAESGFDADEMALHRQVTRWCRGRLVQGDTGAQLCREAEVWMRERGLGHPEKFILFMSPAFAP